MAKKYKMNEIRSILSEDNDFIKPLSKMIHEILECEMNEIIGADQYERTSSRIGYRAGYYSRQFITRVGVLELQITRDRSGKFSSEQRVFQNHRRF